LFFFALFAWTFLIIIQTRFFDNTRVNVLRLSPFRGLGCGRCWVLCAGGSEEVFADNADSRRFNCDTKALGTGFWALGAGCWSLDAGYLLLIPNNQLLSGYSLRSLFFFALFAWTFLIIIQTSFPAHGSHPSRNAQYQ